MKIFLQNWKTFDLWVILLYSLFDWKYQSLFFILKHNPSIQKGLQVNKTPTVCDDSAFADRAWCFMGRMANINESRISELFSHVASNRAKFWVVNMANGI